MIRAAIFDLDGLLIDSEPLWRRGEAQVYRSLGMPVTEEEIRETTGLRMDEMLAYWYHKYPLPGLPPHPPPPRPVPNLHSLMTGFARAEIRTPSLSRRPRRREPRWRTRPSKPFFQ